MELCLGMSDELAGWKLVSVGIGGQKRIEKYYDGGLL